MMEETDQQDFYEDFWSRTEDQRVFGPVGRHTRRLIRRILSGIQFVDVLDVGCGEGTLLTQLFGNRGDLRIVGADLSPRALSFAQKKNPEMEFITYDLRKGPLQNSFDLIICSEVLEHLYDDEQAVSVMSQMCNRYLLVTTLAGRMRKHEEDIGHLRNYTAQGLRAMVEANNMKVIKMYEWGWPFFSPLYRNLLELLASRTRDATTGSFGFSRKLLCNFLYALFFLNQSRKGDQLVMLAEKTE